MRGLNTFLKIIRYLGKALLGLLIALLITIALVHLPPAQKLITNKTSTFLSSKLEARVEINRISFSILGHVAIEDLSVWDPDSNMIFSARKIEVSSNIINLLSGDLIFDEISMSGAEGHLIQGEQGFNIQYIIDAFRPTEKKPSAKSNPVLLQFKNILLENIMFDFTSTVNGVTVSINLGKLIGKEAELLTMPTTIRADLVSLQHTIVNTLLNSRPDTSKIVATTVNKYLSPDLGTGITIEIKNLELDNDSFAFHQDQIKRTPKFDPAHLDLSRIQIKLSDIVIHKDTLAAGLQLLSFELPGFTLTNARAGLHFGHNQLGLSDFQLESGDNQLNADLIVPNNFMPTTGEGNDYFQFLIQSHLNPKDFSYFLNDSLLNQFGQWGRTELTAEGNYSLGKGEIKKLSLLTKNSQVHAKGLLRNLWDIHKISWTDMIVNASVGADFQKVLTPFINNINLPPDITLHLMSSGNPDKILVDGKIATSWGNVITTGQINPLENNLVIDANVVGEMVDLSKWLNISFAGPMSLTANAKGKIGNNQLIEIDGLITEIALLNQPIHQIGFQSRIREDDADVAVTIQDRYYRSKINSEISFTETLKFTNTIQLDSFNVGRLLQRDSTLFISGDTKSEIIIGPTSQEGFLAGKRMLIHMQSMEYELDSITMHALLSPEKSHFSYDADYANVNLESNFDIREFPEVIQRWSKHAIKSPDQHLDTLAARTVDFVLDLENVKFIKLLGVDVDEFSGFHVRGKLDEQKQTAVMQAASGKFTGYGLSMDSLNTRLEAHRDSIRVSMVADNLLYHAITLGNLGFELVTKGDTATSNLLLTSDSLTLLNLQTRILPTDSGVYIYPEKLLIFDQDHSVDPGNPVHIKDNNLAFHQFSISHDDMLINLDGDLNAFDASFKNISLTPLNFLLSPDTVIINKGHLSGHIAYSNDQQLNLKADIDSLILYNSSPLTLSATAMSEDNQVPFELLLSNASNKIDLHGQYFSNDGKVDASLLLDINNMETFAFLVSGILDEMEGAIQGEAAISGTLQTPELKGYLQFKDIRLTTANPKLSFNIEEDRIELDQSGLLFNNFTLYDQERHPLTISGSVTSKDYQSFNYDLQINSNQYTLINHPDTTSGNLRGFLVLDSDIKLKGNNKDTNIRAKLNIKNETDLTVVTSNDEIELLKAEGIIEYIDPSQETDSVSLMSTLSYYDSLIATLPEFNLNSTVTIEKNAVLRVLIDEQSGDYIEASGGADLELNYDRTGNLQLSGNYTVNKGVYRLSFYDLVKKNFTLVQGSSINWHGNPKNGDLSIKAVHSVKSNSLGLVGHEIGENEESIYTRSLEYEVGINIIGTIDKPIIYFSLDLPQNEKVNYPVLANKLDRLRQPEYESELNKQVFGLLVLGGFLPESTGADFNSNLIATTALSNSVNSLLASQLNRFASQYIKGVNIDVGIQSFSDYSAPGGKTQTAMDFRVSKKVMDDRLSFEIGGDFNINQDQSGANSGNKNYRSDIAIIYDLTGKGDKQLKLFNNETYDIVYQEIRNTGISLIFIREFEISKKERKKKKDK